VVLALLYLYDCVYLDLELLSGHGEVVGIEMKIREVTISGVFLQI